MAANLLHDQSAQRTLASWSHWRYVRIALQTLDRRSAPPSVITNGRPLALASKFLPRRQVVRFMGWSQRRAMSHA